MKKLMIVFFTAFMSYSVQAGVIKSCNSEQSKCYTDPLKAEKGDLILIFSKSGNSIIAKAKVLKSSPTATELEIVEKKKDKYISSGFTAIKMQVDSNDIWTTTTPSI